jgi:hypothetical protein
MIARFILVIVLFAHVHFLLAQDGGETVFYVASTGNDKNVGTETAPFASIERAQQAVREKIASGLSGNVQVIVHGGRYELSNPLVFTPKDSGTANYSITYAAAPGERVVVSGGHRITNWSKGDGNVWSAEVPEVKAGKWYFRNLYVNDKRATRARNPNADDKMPYFTLAGISLSQDKQTWAMKLAPEHVANWKNLSDVEIVIMQQWVITRKKLLSVDPVSGTMILQPPYIASTGRIEPRAGFFCYLENARTFLDQPGEWYLDRERGTLSYWPRLGEDLNLAEVTAPYLNALVEVRGTASQPVENLHFVGISLEHTDSELPPQGYVGAAHGFCRGPDAHSAYRFDSAVHWEFARGCSIESSVVAHLGGNALDVDQGCANTLIRGNQIYDVGDIGIAIGLAHSSYQTWPTLARQPRSTRVADNHIHDCSMSYYDGAAVLVLAASQTFVTHNLIHDSGLHGIAIATWRQVPPSGIADGYYIQNNEIHHVVKVLGDGGSIYVWGVQTKGVISSNVIHDVTTSKVGGPEYDGIYFDDESTGYHVEGNVVYDIVGKPLELINCHSDSFVFHDNFWYSTNAFVRGKIGYALKFDGDRFLDLPHQAALEPSQMTVEAWVNLYHLPEGSDPSAWIICKNANELTDGNYALLVSHNNVGAYLNIGGGRENCHAAWSSSGPLKPGTWHLLAMTYNGTNLNVFCDGQQVATGAIGRPRTTGDGPLRLGKRGDGYNPSFPGLINEVRVYNRALSDAELEAQCISPSTLAPHAPDLVFRWNVTDTYSKMQQIMANAGPEEPYRTRLLNDKPASTAVTTGDELNAGFATHAARQ